MSSYRWLEIRLYLAAAMLCFCFVAHVSAGEASAIWSTDACLAFDSVSWSRHVESRCCPIGSSGHRRRAQAASPCDGRPPRTCAGECALVFLPFVIGCGEMLGLSKVPSLREFIEICDAGALSAVVESSPTCSENNGGCQGTCTQLDGGNAICSCPSGYTLMQDGQTCTDDDECTIANGGCVYLCMNLPGGRQCSCPDGHALAADGSSCDGIVQASLDNPVGHIEEHTCTDDDEYVHQHFAHSCQEILAGGACSQLVQHGASAYCCASCGAPAGEFDELCDMTVDLGPGVGHQQLFTWEPDTQKCTLDMNALSVACSGEYFAQCLSFLASSQEDEDAGGGRRRQ